MNPLIEVTDIMERLEKPTPPRVRAQLELRIRELEAEYVAWAASDGALEQQPAC